MMRRVTCPVLPLWRDEKCDRRLRELLYGEYFSVQNQFGDLAFGQTAKDGYTGYVKLSGLGATVPATHVVSSRATHLYAAPDIKSPALMGLSFGSLLAVTGQQGKFLETQDGGFVPVDHARPIRDKMDDPAAVAEIFLGAPYLWGGNSSWGIDCSGLVQAALLASGQDCPADSAQQAHSAGQPIDSDVPVRRGDLLFWQSHVAMVLDDENLIHATAAHMAVVVENIAQVTDRIAAQGYGDIVARRRP